MLERLIARQNNPVTFGQGITDAVSFLKNLCYRSVEAV